MSFNVACIERTSNGLSVYLVDSNDKERTVTVWYPKSRLPRVNDYRTTTPSCFDLHQETYALLDSELLAVVKQAEIACTVHDIEYTESLPDDTVFVFGSNEAGRHGAGAAYTAAKCFGVKYGSTRTVLLMGKYALKIPSTVEYRLFLLGLLGNLQEKRFSDSDPRLCPVIFSMPFGLMNIMPRARKLSRDEFFALDYKAFVDSSNGQYSISDMTERKMDTFGWLNGRIVVVDYGG